MWLFCYYVNHVLGSLKCWYDNVQDISFSTLEILSCAVWMKGLRI